MLGHEETICSCEKCKAMCKTPCLGTPEDIYKLIMNNYGDKLCMTGWGVGKLVGTNDTIIEMIQPIQNENGCVFQDECGLCKLHDLGLKPTEGKFSSCKDKPTLDFTTTINYKVAMSWVDENGENDARKMLIKESIKHE